MKRSSWAGVVGACLIAILAACQTAPITGRQQFIAVSERESLQLGADAYRQILAKSRVSRDSQMSAAVDRVVSRLAGQANRPDFRWEYTLIEDPTPNAFALPGGKIGVHTGIFKVARNDAQLAAVLAHEIGHVMANHSAERITRQMAVQAGLSVAGLASPSLAQYSDLLVQAATLGLVLPFTREQESEADTIGTIYMARAGYDPREAIALWRNFAAEGGNKPPEFLSSHPADSTRIRNLETLMPRALSEYRPAGR
jgi:predicted Zn-dependent protease